MQGYGNIFYDAILLGNLWKHRATGGELEQKREINLIEKIKTDRDIHKDDIIPFTYNEINNVYKLATGFTNEWNKVFNFLGKLNYAYDDKDSKLKALAKLYYLSKKVGYRNLNVMLSSSMVYCNIFSNELDVEKLKITTFNYSLPNLVINLLEGLTPNEVYGLFPIDKEYDGYKLETKDYYSCIKAAKEIGLNKHMDHEETKDFVMECDTHIFIFNTGVAIMSLVSDFNGWDIYDIIKMFKDENPKLHIVK
ncbi:hypothetical protein [Intestinibacter bartlettii]|uniref:hypothetical protein n=1 Tax=Intestinibacter bartlettii TaxID=261299 RepID=UPI0026DD03CD|nr:hypothetical protein [uncultured Romboutsia sp.]